MKSLTWILIKYRTSDLVIHLDNDTFTFGLVRQSVPSPHNRRLMSRARRTRHIARIARRGEETKLKSFIFFFSPRLRLLRRRF